jgi:hypothetical protein
MLYEYVSFFPNSVACAVSEINVNVRFEVFMAV